MRKKLDCFSDLVGFFPNLRNLGAQLLFFGMHSLLLRALQTPRAADDDLSNRIERLSVRSPPRTPLPSPFTLRPSIAKADLAHKARQREMRLAMLLHRKEFDRAEGEGKLAYRVPTRPPF